MARNEGSILDANEMSLADGIEESITETNAKIRGWAVKWENNEAQYLHDETQISMETITRLSDTCYLTTVPHEAEAEDFFIWHDDQEQATLISLSTIKNGSGWTLNLLIPYHVLEATYHEDPYPFLEQLKKSIKQVNTTRWQAFIPKERQVKPHDKTKDQQHCVKTMLEKMGASTALIESSINAMHGKDVRLLLLHDDPKVLFEITHALLIAMPTSERKRFTCAGNIRRLPSELIKKSFKVMGLIPSDSNMDVQTYVKLLEEDSQQSTFVLDLKRHLTGGVVFLIHPIPWLKRISYQLATALKLGEEQRARDLLVAIEELDSIVQLEQQLSRLPPTKETIQQCFNAAVVADKHGVKTLTKTFLAHGIKVACSLPEFTDTFNMVNSFITQFKNDEEREEILAAFRKNLNVVAFRNASPVFHANWIRWFHLLYSEAQQNNSFRTKRELTRLWMTAQEHLTITEEKVLPLVIEILSGFFSAKEDVDDTVFDLASNESTPLDIRVKILKESMERGFVDETKMKDDPITYLHDHVPKLDKLFKVLTVTWLAIPWTDPIDLLLIPLVKKIRKRDDLPLYLKHILKFLHDVLSVQTFELKRINDVLSDIYKQLAGNDKSLMNRIQEVVLLVIQNPASYNDVSVTQLVASVERDYHLSKARKSRHPATRLEHLKESFKSALFTEDMADEQQILALLLKEKMSGPRVLELGSFLINEIKRLGTDAALHLTTTLLVYESVLKKARRQTRDYRTLISWIEDSVEFTRFFKFKLEEQQELLISLVEESINIAKDVPQEQQPSLIAKLVIPWSKINDSRKACQYYKKMFDLIKKHRSITDLESFFQATREALHAAEKQPLDLESLDSEKQQQAIKRLIDKARSWKQHEKDKKMMATAESCIKEACKTNDLATVLLVIEILSSA